MNNSDRTPKVKSTETTGARVARYLFGSTASLTIVILALIVIFLFREGAGFLGGYQESLEKYRRSGLEFVDIQQSKYTAYIDLQNELFGIRAEWIKRLQEERKSQSSIMGILGANTTQKNFAGYSELGNELNEHLKEQVAAIIVRRSASNMQGSILHSEQQSQSLEAHKQILADLSVGMIQLSAEIAELNTGYDDLNRKLADFAEKNSLFTESLDEHYRQLEQWHPDAEVGKLHSLFAFLTGRHWVTASDQHDWYGLLPILSGSILITCIALGISVPLAVGAAIYINQIAKPVERTLIKPYIEFISALPSVVIGFFGVMVFGELLRLISQQSLFAWLPFFPVEERLNAFTAGALLALMAIPTIFTLTEDALNNVPKSLKEASSALGATQLQTIILVIVPNALTGIISAILLGFGRVVGETMIVLLCAGNRIKIPSIDMKGEFFFEPVHSMTGLIAQEMGEVVYGSLHYRALFVVGIVLFLITLLVNYAAQTIAKRYTHPIY